MGGKECSINSPATHLCVNSCGVIAQLFDIFCLAAGD